MVKWDEVVNVSPTGVLNNTRTLWCWGQNNHPYQAIAKGILLKCSRLIFSKNSWDPEHFMGRIQILSFISSWLKLILSMSSDFTCRVLLANCLRGSILSPGLLTRNGGSFVNNCQLFLPILSNRSVSPFFGSSLILHNFNKTSMKV